MTAFHFRQMQAGDLEQVNLLQQQSADSSWNLAKFSDSLLGNDECWVCCSDSAHHAEAELLAFAIVSSVLDESSLLTICVDKDYQRQGYAKAMMQHLIAQAHAQKRVKFFLEVRTSNLRAIKLYTLSGFELVGCRKDYYPTASGREDALVYTLILEPDTSSESG